MKLSELYGNMLARGFEGESLEYLRRMLVRCEAAGELEGALGLLEVLSPHLSPKARAAGQALVEKYKAVSDAQIEADLLLADDIPKA